MQFAFDYAFDETVPQTEVFEKTSHFLLDGVIEGYNATIFAYGATGAGKTYTYYSIIHFLEGQVNNKLEFKINQSGWEQ